MMEKQKYGLDNMKRLLRGKWNASIIIEASLVIPLILLLTIWMIQIGILVYDSNTMELTVQEQVKTNLLSGKEWNTSLQSALEKRMFNTSPVQIQQIGKGQYQIQMKIAWYWVNNVKVILPRENKELLYHFVNGKQLIEHIPLLEKARDKYFKELKKIKKD